MKKELTTHQANALIQRADLAVNESKIALLSAQETMRMAEHAHRQALELRALVHEAVRIFMDEKND